MEEDKKKNGDELSQLIPVVTIKNNLIKQVTNFPYISLFIVRMCLFVIFPACGCD